MKNSYDFNNLRKDMIWFEFLAGVSFSFLSFVKIFFFTYSISATILGTGGPDKQEKQGHSWSTHLVGVWRGDNTTENSCIDNL